MIMALGCWFAGFATRVNGRRLAVALHAALEDAQRSNTLSYAAIVFYGLGALYATLGLALAANALVPGAVVFAPIAAALVVVSLLIGDSQISTTLAPPQEATVDKETPAAPGEAVIPAAASHAATLRRVGAQATSLIPPSSTSAVTTDVEVESERPVPSFRPVLPRLGDSHLPQFALSSKLGASVDRDMASRAPAKRSAATAVPAGTGVPPLRRGASGGSALSPPSKASWTGHTLLAPGVAGSGAWSPGNTSHGDSPSSLGEAFGSLFPAGAALIPELTTPVLPKNRPAPMGTDVAPHALAASEIPVDAGSPLASVVGRQSGVRAVQPQSLSERGRGRQTIPQRKLGAGGPGASRQDADAMTDRVDGPPFLDADVPTTPAPPRIRPSTQAPPSEAQRHGYDVEIPKSPRAPDFSAVYANEASPTFPGVHAEPAGLRPTVPAPPPFEEVASGPTRQSVGDEREVDARSRSLAVTSAATARPRRPGLEAALPPPKHGQSHEAESPFSPPHRSQFEIAYHQAGAPGYLEAASETTGDLVDVTPEMPESATQQRRAADPEAASDDAAEAEFKRDRGSGDPEAGRATPTTSDVVAAPVTTSFTPPTRLDSEVRWTDAHMPRHALPPGPNPNPGELSDESEPRMAEDGILRGRQKSALH